VPAKEITRQFVIVGEGAGDAMFFNHLCTVNSIAGYQCLDAGGTGKFEQYLKDLPALSGFRRHCKVLVIVGDNDDSPDDKLKEVRLAVKRASTHLGRLSPPFVLPVPENSFQIAKYTTSDLRVVIMMLPFDAHENRTKGCLETLLLESAAAKNPAIAACVPAFGTCIGVQGWANGSHVDKFKLRAILAAKFPQDPNFALQYALDPAHDVIPLNHAAFDPIVDFLKGLPGRL
jgi:uncharacterized protein DUF3226